MNDINVFKTPTSIARLYFTSRRLPDFIIEFAGYKPDRSDDAYPCWFHRFMTRLLLGWSWERIQ